MFNRSLDPRGPTSQPLGRPQTCMTRFAYSMNAESVRSSCRGNGRAIEGIISERDVVRAAASGGSAALDRSVGSVMSTDVVTCATGDGVDRLMSLMTERRIRHLPVVDDNGHLAGIVSIGDVVKARLNELEDENRALADYISGH